MELLHQYIIQLLVPDQDVHFVYVRSHFTAPQSGHANFSTYLGIFHLNILVHILIFDLYTGIIFIQNLFTVVV